MSAQAEKVYLVTVGEYSAYEVLAVFTTREKAEQFLVIVPATMTYNDDPKIEECPLDPSFPHLKPGWAFWHVRMGADGSVLDACRQATRYYLDPEPTSGEQSWSYFDQLGWGSATVYAPDQAAAIKIVNEQRARWKADPATRIDRQWAPCAWCHRRIKQELGKTWKCSACDKLVCFDCMKSHWVGRVACPEHIGE